MTRVGTRLHGNQPWDADRGSGVKLCWNFCRIHRTEIWGAALEPTACSDAHILPGLTLARRPGLCSGDKGQLTARLPDQLHRLQSTGDPSNHLLPAPHPRPVLCPVLGVLKHWKRFTQTRWGTPGFICYSEMTVNGQVCRLHTQEPEACPNPDTWK